MNILGQGFQKLENYGQTCTTDGREWKHYNAAFVDDCNDNENNIAFHWKADHPRADTLCCSCDLRLDSMTLIYELDLDISKM